MPISEIYKNNSGKITIMLAVINIVLATLLLWALKTRDGFRPDMVQVLNLPRDYNQKEIQLKNLPNREPGTEIIESGRDFISNKKYYSPWGAMINLEHPSQDRESQINTDTAVNGLNNNRCSLSCCSKQWPLPFKLSTDGEDLTGNIPNNYTCNNGLQDSGCLCMTKPQADFLDSRGTNN
jgi:hypothetical protein